GLLQNPDVQAKHARPVQVGPVVEVAVVLDDDGREGKPPCPLEVALGVVDEERVAPRHLRRAVLLRRDLHVDAGIVGGYELTDRGFVQGGLLNVAWRRAPTQLVGGAGMSKLVEYWLPPPVMTSR